MKKSFILLSSALLFLAACTTTQNTISEENPDSQASGMIIPEEPSVIPWSDSGSAISWSDSGSAMGTGEEIFPEEIVYESGMKVTSWGYVGLEEKDAMQIAKENNTPFRVVERDGESLPVTEDYAKGRINASVEEGEIVSYTIE